MQEVVTLPLPWDSRMCLVTPPQPLGCSTKRCRWTAGARWARGQALPPHSTSPALLPSPESVPPVREGLSSCLGRRKLPLYHLYVSHRGHSTPIPAFQLRIVGFLNGFSLEPASETYFRARSWPWMACPCLVFPFLRSTRSLSPNAEGVREREMPQTSTPGPRKLYTLKPCSFPCSVQRSKRKICVCFTI